MQTFLAAQTLIDENISHIICREESDNAGKATETPTAQFIEIRTGGNEDVGLHTLGPDNSWT